MELEKIKELALANGFSLKEQASGNMDLHSYVYEFANALLREATPEGFILVPKEPTQAMLDSARDWSIKKYGKAVGNDGASGCYKAMIEAQEQSHD
ncbi:hypothetical protein HUN33_12215 [Acinetobacter bereziniae]|uniref:hypothetical protein n=1 Tax=Acinetobacter bereziniae TaxID=106648 RepID=UPI0015807777|nr:hypothetical protein [Acinetobacter bereziniae]NUF61576.1 hypothetical protein [Acinetobacter bereziniae]NUG08909.1 hypothetical protein [Acinetobacter bereziniae]NUG62337.1 hypothetical protein [Acinetobacter bereziniae]NUG70597.1 hypothetical protein [Acinetobacter bereziniae]NUG80813.1 hypothetical protein [Acinetobacter bereziniae]